MGRIYIYKPIYKELLDTELGNCVRRIRANYVKDKFGPGYDNDKKDLLIISIIADYLKYMFYAAMHGYIWNIPNMIGRIYMKMEKIDPIQLNKKHILRVKKYFNYKFLFVIESRYLVQKKYYFNPYNKYIYSFKKLLEKGLASDYYENHLGNKIENIKF